MRATPSRLCLNVTRPSGLLASAAAAYLVISALSALAFPASADAEVGGAPANNYERCDAYAMPCEDPVVLAEGSQLGQDREVVGFSTRLGTCLSFERVGAPQTERLCDAGIEVPDVPVRIDHFRYSGRGSGATTEVGGVLSGEVARLRVGYRTPEGRAGVEPIVGEVDSSRAERIGAASSFGVFDFVIDGRPPPRSIRIQAYSERGKLIWTTRPHGPTDPNVGSSSPPNRAIVGTFAQYTKSSLGSYCTVGRARPGGTQGIGCTDSVPNPAPPRGGLVLAPRQSFTMRFPHVRGIQDRIESLTATLVRITKRGNYRPLGRFDSVKQLSLERWRLKLPKQLRRANVIEVRVRFEGDLAGDATHRIGLDVRRRQPLECPQPFYAPIKMAGLRGLTEARAERYLERRGCTLRVLRRDGVGQDSTDDLRNHRINVAIVDGRVSRVFGLA